MKEIYLPQMNPEQVADEIGQFIIDQATKIGFTGSVIGLSGGVDSTVSAALAKRAFDKYNNGLDDGRENQRLELVGYLLPSNVNNPADTEDGEDVAQRLGVRYELINLQPLVEAHAATNPEALDDKFHRGNLTSRIRANVLNTKGAVERKLVQGTGNKDEDFGIGYYTLFGDGAVHTSPIGNLSKRLVRQMAEYLGFADLADRIPTAGLEPGQTDFKDLGYSYDFVELVTEGLAQGVRADELAQHPQVRTLAERELHTYQEAFGAPKYHSVDDMVEDLLFRHQHIAPAKAALISPPIAPVTLAYKPAE